MRISEIILVRRYRRWQSWIYYFILFPINYLKEVLIQKKISWNIQRNPNNSFSGLDVGSIWVSRSELSTEETGGQQQSWICLKVSHFIIPIERMLNIMMGSSTIFKCNRRGTLTSLMHLIRHGLMYWMNYDGMVQQVCSRIYVCWV